MSGNYTSLVSADTVPATSLAWLTAEILDLLRAIRGRRDVVAKKRYTLIQVAIARATPGISENSVFQDDPQVCARSTWYGKWSHEPEIQAALAACEQRLQDWRDAETLLIEAHAAQLRRRGYAEGSLDGLRGLRKIVLSEQARAADRIEASKVLLKLADPALTELLDGTRSAVPVEISNLDDLIEYELARVAGGGEAGAAEPVADAPDPP